MLMQVCQEFDDIHSMAAHDMLKEYYIGDLEAADEETKVMGPDREDTGPTSGWLTGWGRRPSLWLPRLSLMSAG